MRCSPRSKRAPIRASWSTPLNNAHVAWTRIRYHHRLQDFQALLEREGDLRLAVQYLKDGVDRVDDPFDLLPGG